MNINLINHYPQGTTEEESIKINKRTWSEDFKYRLNLNMQSISGYGSSLVYLDTFINEFPSILKEYEIKSFLDIPCGDYWIMKEFNWKGIKYIGADLVEEQILWNKQKYPEIDFIVLNMITDKLPESDMIFTRDCLIHMSFRNITLFLENVRSSNSKYIVASTSPITTNNTELGGIIGYRPLNLELPPINFPKPIKLIKEEGKKLDKCLGLWKISDLKI